MLELCLEEHHLATHARAAQHAGQLLQDGPQGSRGGAQHQSRHTRLSREEMVRRGR